MQAHELLLQIAVREKLGMVGKGRKANYCACWRIYWKHNRRMHGGMDGWTDGQMEAFRLIDR